MSKNLLPVRFKVHDRIFNQEVHVFCNMDGADLLAWQKRLGVKDQDNEGLNPNYRAFSTHYTCDGEPNVYLIWLNRFDWTLDDQDSLVHECTHIIFRIWGANNIPVAPENQEFLAHSIAHLYADIAAKILLRKTSKGTKK